MPASLDTLAHNVSSSSCRSDRDLLYVIKELASWQTTNGVFLSSHHKIVLHTPKAPKTVSRWRTSGLWLDCSDGLNSSNKEVSGSASAWLATIPRTRDIHFRSGSCVDVVNVCTAWRARIVSAQRPGDLSAIKIWNKECIYSYVVAISLPHA